MAASAVTMQAQKFALVDMRLRPSIRTIRTK